MTSIALGRYQLARRLAVGGMAEVLLAHIDGPEGFRRPVVLKRLLPALASRPDIVAMFLNEARVAARFDHPNLIQVYELFEADGQYCLAMELLDGIDAHTLLARHGKLTAAATCAVVSQAAAGLHHAHELSLVHRDVSPSNVFITRSGVVKVVDFGIAKRTQGEGQELTAVRGKPSYMSPEHIRNEPLDRRTDVFALGVVAYELLTGRPCFRGSFGEIAAAIVSGTKRPIAELVDDCPAELIVVIERMMATDRDARYATAADARADLRRVQSSLGTAGHELAELIDMKSFASEPLPTRVPTAVADVATTIVSGPLASPATPITDDLLAAAPARTRQTRWPMWVAAAALLVVAGGIYALATRQSARAPDPDPVAVAPQPVPQPSPMPTPPAASPPETSVAPERAPPAPQARPSPRSRARQREAPPPKGPGKIVVDAKPWAEVYLGERKLGVTPLREQDLPEGSYTLSLRNPQLGVQRDVRITIKSGEVTKVFETLR